MKFKENISIYVVDAKKRKEYNKIAYQKKKKMNYTIEDLKRHVYNLKGSGIGDDLHLFAFKMRKGDPLFHS